jgi:hypothetical protein
LLGLFPSHVTLIYSIYGLLYTTFGLGVRHHPAGLLGALVAVRHRMSVYVGIRVCCMCK